MRISSSGNPVPGPEAVAGQVEPARLVPGRLEPLLGQVAERLPEGAQGRRRPLVAGDVQHLFQPLDQPRRARAPRAAPPAPNAVRIAAMAASSSDCSMTTAVGLLAGDRRRGRPGGPAGPAELDLEPPAAVVGPATGTRARPCRPPSPAPPAGPGRARPSPCGRPASGSASGGSSRIESGSAATRSPGRSSARTELLASGKATGWPISRSKSRRSIAISSPSWASRGTTQSQGRSVRSGLEPDVERPRRAAADPDAAAAADHAVIGRAVGHGQVERGVGQDARGVGRAGVVGEPRARRPRRSGRGRRRGQGAAVEEDGVGPGGAVVGRAAPRGRSPRPGAGGGRRARCCGIAGSATNGRPNSWSPSFAPAAGSSPRATAGKKPSRTTSRPPRGSAPTGGCRR